jgi:hypothetical protein
MNQLTSAVDSIDIEYSERKTGDRLLISMAKPGEASAGLFADGGQS